MPGDDHFGDEFLTVYLEASDRYTDSVDQMSELAGANHAAFLVSHERVKRLRVEVEDARSAMEKHRLQNHLKQSA